MTFDIHSVGMTVGLWFAVAVVAMLLVWGRAGPPAVRPPHRILWVFRGACLQRW